MNSLPPYNVLFAAIKAPDENHKRELVAVSPENKAFMNEKIKVMADQRMNMLSLVKRPIFG